MSASLIFTRSRQAWLDLPIRAWEGDDAGHVGVCVDGLVVDATLRHGVQPWPYEAFVRNRIVVQQLHIEPASDDAEADALVWLMGRVGRRYDLRGILGFPLLRDMDDPERDWCSELAAGWFTRHTGTPLPGRTGRRGVRVLRWMAQGYSTGRAVTEGAA
jgi:hypothetical protein